MKLYDFPGAPNPRRLRIFMAEKGIKVPLEQLEILKGAGRTPEFLKKNPFGGIPLLELDDGSYLAESVAICRYLEGLHPEPNLMGKDFREQALIEMWQRRAELSLFGSIGRAFQNTNPIIAPVIGQQFPEYGAKQLATAQQTLAVFDAQLKGKEFIAGPRYTIADITALVAIEFGKQNAGLQLDPALKEIARWHQAVSSRPSAKA
ncbi:MAG TPA: glutathione S-transferase [Candidatus Binataceae bacterium]|nr:glutathione S-transferase [Candidatus Binataceae bacterium]